MHENVDGVVFILLFIGNYLIVTLLQNRTLFIYFNIDFSIHFNAHFIAECALKITL